MRKVQLAPRFKLWLILVTTAGVIITALLALMLAWGPAPVVETPNAAAPPGNLSVFGSISGSVLVPLPGLAATTEAPWGVIGARPHTNSPVLALSSGVALAMSFGALWAARRRRNAGAPEQVSPGLNTSQRVVPAVSL